MALPGTSIIGTSQSGTVDLRLPLVDDGSGKGTGTLPISGTVATTAPANQVVSQPTAALLNATVVGTVGVNNFPATQPISGTVGVNNFPASQAVTGTFFQGTQPVSMATAPTTPVTGTFFQATQPVSGTFFQSTQPVSIASMPSTPVTGTFWQTTQPISGTVGVNNFPASQAVTGTFFQATQPVSIATMPSTPVTGTFWQATQPVSGTVTANQGTANTAANAWPGKVTDGTNVAAVKAGVVAVAGDNPLVVTVHPSSAPTTAQPVTGTVAVTESGTWTVQPGNTPNTTPWLVNAPKDVVANRTRVLLSAVGVAGVAAETAVTLSITKGGTAQTAAASYTVTAGKTLRIQSILVGNSGSAAETSTFRLRNTSLTGAIEWQARLVFGAATANSATIGNGFPDGLEFAAGTVLVASHISALTGIDDVTINGYEY